jgi:hypothetical protein
MSTSEKLARFNLEIYEVSHQERLTVDGRRCLPLKEEELVKNITHMLNLRFKPE